VHFSNAFGGLLMSDMRTASRIGFFALTLLLAGTVASQPSLAIDSAATAKKVLCHTCLVKIYSAQHKYPEAAVEYAALLAYTPNDARMHFEYGRTLAQMQKNGPALAQYRAAARIDPSVAEYQAGLGFACLYAKDYGGAVAALTKACQLGGKYQKELSLAQQYQMQNQQIKQYEKKVEQKKEDEDD
jgi:predicted Zn-dependent protease